jgi:hypothetical protein
MCELRRFEKLEEEELSIFGLLLFFELLRWILLMCVCSASLCVCVYIYIDTASSNGNARLGTNILFFQAPRQEHATDQQKLDLVSMATVVGTGAERLSLIF